jgi:nucleotide-binding universal stress UspA family protein
MSWPYGPQASAADDVSLEQLDELYEASVLAAYEAVGPQPGWVLQFARGDAGPVLVDRSRHATALVIGRPAFTGASRLLVGSVAHHCLRHATCPVVTVPPGRAGAQGAPPAHSHHEVTA